MNRSIPPPAGLHPLARRDLAVIERTETHAQAAGRLFAEARAEAQAHLNDLAHRLAAAAGMATDVATGGDVYPAGIRDEAARLAEAIRLTAQRIEAIRAGSVR